MSPPLKRSGFEPLRPTWLEREIAKRRREAEAARQRDAQWARMHADLLDAGRAHEARAMLLAPAHCTRGEAA